MPDPALRALQTMILRVCQSRPDGLTDAEIVKHLDKNVQPKHRLDSYNELLRNGRLKLLKKTVGEGAQKKDVVVYQWVSLKDAEKFRGLDAAERMVYDMIERSGQNGVTKRDMKFRTNIQNPSELKQIVERLIARGLVKEIKSVQGTNKKVYIASDVEPSTAHTGGPWYNDEQEFDTVFIDTIYAQVVNYMFSMEYVTVDSVTEYVADLNISNEPLSKSDIRQLMMTMLYDSAIEQCSGRNDGGEYFRIVTNTPAVNHLSSIPCGSCPVFHDCSPDGVISPKTCVYMKEWLQQAADW
ncbi:RNA polymerase Rpc34 subunit [Gracilaria domingensis]|nr:RNA polymerase Rpc34 subunit [Gracilaria domingensis]